jgi:hypothetical protein
MKIKFRLGNYIEQDLLGEPKCRRKDNTDSSVWKKVGVVISSYKLPVIEL